MWGLKLCYFVGKADRYCVMLESCLRSRVDTLLDEHGQDGAIAHTAYRSMPILREIVYGHVASLSGDIW